MVVVTSRLVTYVSDYVNPCPGSLPREARSRRSQAAQACCSIRGTKALAGTPW